MIDNNENDANPVRTSPLMKACYQNDVEGVLQCIHHGANVNEIGILGITALMIAARNNNTMITEILIKEGANIHYNISNGLPEASSALLEAAQSGAIETLKLLLKHSVDPNQVSLANGVTGLMITAKKNNVEAAAVLIEQGANIELKTFDIFQETALCFAVKEGNYEMTKFLIENNAKIKPLRSIQRTKIPPKMVKWLKANKWL